MWDCGGRVSIANKIGLATATRPSGETGTSPIDTDPLGSLSSRNDFILFQKCDQNQRYDNQKSDKCRGRRGAGVEYGLTIALLLYMQLLKPLSCLMSFLTKVPARTLCVVELKSDILLLSREEAKIEPSSLIAGARV